MVPGTARRRTVEVLELFNRMIAFPGRSFNDQKTIVNQVQALLTSFVNSPNVTTKVANLRTQNTNFSVKNAKLAILNLRLQTENGGLVPDLQNS
jgi:hypothetical protein